MAKYEEIHNQLKHNKELVKHIEQQLVKHSIKLTKAVDLFESLPDRRYEDEEEK